MMKRHGGLKVGIRWIGYISRHSIDFHKGTLRESSSDESEGEQEEEVEDLNWENERSPPLFAGAKAGSSKTNSDDVLASPTKNT